MMLHQLVYASTSLAPRQHPTLKRPQSSSMSWRLGGKSEWVTVSRYTHDID